MKEEEKVYKTIKKLSNSIIKNSKDWKREIASAKNYIATPDFNHWTFGKSAGIEPEYFSDGGIAKKYHYKIGFADILKLPDNKFRRSVINAFYKWAVKVEAVDIIKKFEKDQGNKKRFELLVHNTIIPKNLLDKTNTSLINQEEFDEGFKRQITIEVSSRSSKANEIAKKKHGTTCVVCAFDFGKTYGPHGFGFIEVHHLEPISLGERKTKVEDLRPVCANCHRMLHRGEELLSINELKGIIKRSKK